MPVREPTVARDSERRFPGVIDTLSAGYAIVNRHPWIIAVPILLDLFFWLGPHLSLAPLVHRSVGRLAVPLDLPADALQSYEQTREVMLQAVDSFNLFALLVSHFPGIPSLMSGREGTWTAVGVDSSWVALGLFLLLPAIGLGLASVYYVTIGRQVGRGEERISLLWRRVWKTWIRLLGFLLLALGIGLLLGLPAGVLFFLFGGANSAVMSFLAAFLWVTALWVQFYLFFVVDAMVISDVGPLLAVRYSVAVVKFHLGSTLALVALIWIVTLGMPIVWDGLAQSTPGIVVGILGNAYISTGLAVASMTYYRDRFASLGVGGQMPGARG